MKYIITLILFLSYDISACEIENKNFDFSYNINGNLISYQIERKDKKTFEYFQRYYFNNKNSPAEFGFFFTKLKIETSINKNNLSLLSESDYKIKKFYNRDNYYTNMLYTVPYENDYTIELPIPAKKMKSVTAIKETVNFKDFIYPFQMQKNNSDFYKQKEIGFEIRIVLDANLEKCIIFKTQPINYEIGPQIYWNLKKFYGIRIFS